jgi:DNA-binding transcriptional LysR family regulator
LPDCSIRPTHEDPAQLAEEVVNGVVDAAIVTLPLKHPELRIEEIRTDRLVVCLRRDNPLSQKAALNAMDLQQNRKNRTQDGRRLKRYRRRWKIERLSCLAAELSPCGRAI